MSPPADTLPCSSISAQTGDWLQPFIEDVVQILAAAVLADLREFPEVSGATDETPRGPTMPPEPFGGTSGVWSRL